MSDTVMFEGLKQGDKVVSVSQSRKRVAAKPNYKLLEVAKVSPKTFVVRSDKYRLQDGEEYPKKSPNSYHTYIRPYAGEWKEAYEAQEADKRAAQDAKEEAERFHRNFGKLPPDEQRTYILEQAREEEFGRPLEVWTVGRYAVVKTASKSDSDQRYEAWVDGRSEGIIADTLEYALILAMCEAADPGDMGNGAAYIARMLKIGEEEL